MLLILLAMQYWFQGLDSIVQLIRERSDSTLLVPGNMLAVAPHNFCRSSSLPPCGLQHCSNDWIVEHAHAFCSICENPLCSLNARCSLWNWSSIFSTYTSKNFCFSWITCCCKQEVKSLESTENKSRGSSLYTASHSRCTIGCYTNELISPVLGKDIHCLNNKTILVFSSLTFEHWNGKKVEIL